VETSASKAQENFEAGEGYRGTKSKLYRSAKESVERGLNFAYTGRKLKKRDFAVFGSCALARRAFEWIELFTTDAWSEAAAIELDRKVLADLAVNQPEAFQGSRVRQRTRWITRKKGPRPKEGSRPEGRNVIALKRHL